jgi:hypothetical protein
MMVELWRVNGEASSRHSRDRTIQLLRWWYPNGFPSDEFDPVHRIVYWFSSDSEIKTASLEDSYVDGDWLRNLKRFPMLEYVSLHHRQVGSGLDSLRGFEKLTRLWIDHAGKGCLSELKRLPQLEGVYLGKPQSGDIDLDGLIDLPKLKTLLIDNCDVLGELLNQLPELSHLEQMIVQKSKNFADDDLACLQRLPKLKYLDIVGCEAVSDAGLIQLSKLENLETLAVRRSSGQITDVGLQSLQQLKKLKELIVLTGDLTPEQIQTLEKLLPNVWIRVN